MFKRCQLKDSFFKDTRVLVFIDTDMTGAKLHGCNATDSLFSRCNVTNLSLKDTGVYGARFEDCTDKGVPITRDWLRARGAIGADLAIISNTVASGRMSFSYRSFR